MPQKRLPLGGLPKSWKDQQQYQPNHKFQITGIWSKLGEQEEKEKV